MNNAWLYVGTLALGVVYTIYLYIKNTEQPQTYGHANRYEDDEEFVEIIPSERRNTTRPTISKLPGTDDMCTICQDHLIRKIPTRKYCLVSLPICGHWFHQKCALRLLEYHPKCPICRINIDRSMIINTVQIKQQPTIDDSGDSSTDNN